jgi:hypothetical protein
VLVALLKKLAEYNGVLKVRLLRRLIPNITL